MKKMFLLILVLILIPFNVVAASNYRPMFFPDTATAFKVTAWRSWYSPSGNGDPDSLKVPTQWYSPTTTNYTEFLEVPGWKTWNSPSTTNYSASLNVPSWKSWKPLSFPDWDKVFSLPWK